MEKDVLVLQEEEVDLRMVLLRLVDFLPEHDCNVSRDDPHCDSRRNTRLQAIVSTNPIARGDTWCSTSNHANLCYHQVALRSK